MSENFKRRGGTLKLQPQNRLLLRVARDLRKTFPDLNVKQAIGMGTHMIGMIQGHMEDIADEMMKGSK